MNKITSPAEVRAQARGELAAVHYATKPENKPADNCPGKHELLQFTTDRSFGCNLCAKRFPKGSVMRGCRSCDYDVCMDCGSAANEPASPKQRPQLSRSSGSYDEVLAAAREKAQRRKAELEHVNMLRHKAAERALQEEARHNRKRRP